MIVSRNAVRKLGELIAVAEKHTLEAMREGRIEMETTATDYFLKSMAENAGMPTMLA